MFRIYVDGTLFCRSDADELAVISPVVTLEANKAGSFTFTVPPTHPFIDAIKTRASIIDVFNNGTLIFEGVAVEQKTDFYNQKSISCEGDLTFFNDSIQRPARYQNQTVRGLLGAYIANHNAQVDDYKRFEVGSVTVTDSNGSIYCYTNYESTMSCIGADLVDDLGGFIRIRHENDLLVTDSDDYVVTNTNDRISVGARYLDYLAASPRTNAQTIRIGKNLLDFTRNMSSVDIATVCIPLGAKLDESSIAGLDERLTIKSVNNGKDFVESNSVGTYGRVVRVVEFDNVTTASALKTKGQQWLSDNQFERMVIEASAFDLSLSEEGFEDFQLLDTVRVVSAPHNLDRNFLISKIVYNLDAPESNTLTLGIDEDAKISAQSAKASGSAQEKGTVSYNTLQEAKSNATSIIESGGHGYVYFDYDDDHVIRSIMVMDTNDPDTATRRWVWNENGFGYEEKTDGEWLYRNAMTMNGGIVADFITTGLLSGGEGSYELNMSTGNIHMAKGDIAGWNFNGTQFYKDVRDPDDNTIRYRTLLQGVLDGHVQSTYILACQKVADGDTYWKDLFVLYSGGNLTLGNTSDSEDHYLRLYSANGRADASNKGFVVYDSQGRKVSEVNSTGLYVTDAETNTLRASIGSGGIKFDDGEYTACMDGNALWFKKDDNVNILARYNFDGSMSGVGTLYSITTSGLTKHIDFGKEFETIPFVSVTLNSANGGLSGWGAANVTKTGFDLYACASSAAVSRSFKWYATTN